MKLIVFAIAALAVFVSVWIFVVVPAERRHHERKLEMLRKRIEQRDAGSSSSQQSGTEEAPDD